MGERIWERISVPWLDQVCNSEDNAKENAHAAYDDVCNAQERVAPAHDGTGGDDDGLGALVLVRREVCHAS